MRDAGACKGHLHVPRISPRGGPSRGRRKRGAADRAGPGAGVKTLVTQGADRNYYVFVVPVLAELDLKKAAKAAGVKSVAMIHVADINKVTGYIRGGCSPVGMKKQFVTVYDESCLAQQTMLVSGGRIGTQIECARRTSSRSHAAGRRPSHRSTRHDAAG